jgi:hypothetical protein
MSMIAAIAFGARHVILSTLQEDLLADEKVTTQLQHKTYDALKSFLAEQMEAMSTAEAVNTLTEIKDLDGLNLSVEIYGDISATALLKEIVSAEIGRVLAPVTNALNADNATPSSVSTAVLNIERRKLIIG